MVVLDHPRAKAHHKTRKNNKEKTKASMDLSKVIKARIEQALDAISDQLFPYHGPLPTH